MGAVFMHWTHVWLSRVVFLATRLRSGVLLTVDRRIYGAATIILFGDVRVGPMGVCHIRFVKNAFQFMEPLLIVNIHLIIKYVRTDTKSGFDEQTYP